MLGAEINRGKPAVLQLATFKTIFVEGARLSTAEIDQVTTLATQCGISNVAEVRTSIGQVSILNVSWKDFEFLVAEAYRRQGYQVDYSLGRGADGGVDLVLKRNGRASLVQCKQWKVLSVGAPVIREMFGLMTAAPPAAAATPAASSGAVPLTPPAKAPGRCEPISMPTIPNMLSWMLTRRRLRYRSGLAKNFGPMFRKELKLRQCGIAWQAKRFACIG